MTDKPDEQGVSPSGDDQSQANESGNPWFVPENAVTDEQLDAMASFELPTLDSDIFVEDDEANPKGGWFNPNAQTEQPAEEPQPDPEPEPAPEPVVAEVEEEAPDEEDSQAIDEDFVGSIRPAASTTADLFAGLEQDEESDEEAVREAPDAPVAFGKSDLRGVPQGPVDEPEEEGLGGLRDQQRPGLSPNEIGKQGDQPIAEAPAKGLGGVSGGQQTRALNDTDQFGNQAPAPNSTSNIPAQGGSNIPQLNPQHSQQQNQQAQKFRDVEQMVTVLRQQYAQGQITRAQLEAELRNNIILDDQGRWWTIGVDSNRWYRYDGREWIPDTPPQTSAMPPVSQQQGGSQPVAGNAVRTETNVPTPAPSGGEINQQQIELDAYGMPLPQQVPVEDPGATMVNLKSATSSNAEQTWEAGEADSDQVSIPDPRAEQTIQSESARSASEAQTMVGENAASNEGISSPIAEEPIAPEKKMEGIHPNYRAAYNRSVDRSDVLRYSIWLGVGSVVIGLGITLCVLLGMVYYYFSVVNQYTDQIETLGQQASSFQTSRIYDANGNVIAEYNDPNQGARTEVPLEEISPYLIHATIATEDETYYENPGFNVFAIMRAIYTNVRSQGPQSGASTITQQLARALVLEDDFAAQVSTERKITEIIIAAELSRKYDKNEIIEFYLNEIYYGNLAYGAEAASQVYFGKSASDLNPYEAAFLAGLPQAPAVYDPVQFREVALGRMDTVLRLMGEANGDGCVQMQHQFYTDQFDLSQPFCLPPSFLDPQQNPDAIIWDAQIRTRIFSPPSINNAQYAHYVNWIFSQLEAEYGPERIFEEGFNVYTTLDPNIQQTAQNEVVRITNAFPAVGNGSVVVMDPQTGAVWAMVGSRDFTDDSIDGQVNVALSPQQPGSSIKPLVYLTALEQSEDYLTPASILWDTPSCWGNYCPPNFDGDFRGPVSVRRALVNSLNIPAVKAMFEVNPTIFEERAQELGLRFPIVTPSEAGLPAALGGVEVRLFDLVSTYSAFANNGQRYEPHGISRIENAEGEVIFEHVPAPFGEPMNPAHAYLINDILTDADTRAEEFGRDARLFVDGHEVALKTGTTGTTTDTFDALTIGWSSQAVVGVWMGNTDNTPIGGATGFQVAAPVFDTVMTATLAGRPASTFEIPTQVINGAPTSLIQSFQVCNDTGAQVPAEGCGVGGSRSEIFYINQPPPPASESLVETVLVDPFTNLRANQFCADYAEQVTFFTFEDGTAIDWMRNDPDGRQWAQQRGIDPNNLQSPPEGECQEGQTRPIATISTPAEGQVVSGFLGVNGTATVPNFVSYSLQYAPLSDQSNFFTITQRDVERPNQNEFLGEWDVSGLADGPYILRLVVTSNTGATAEFNRAVSVVNNTAPAATEAPSGDGDAVPPAELTSPTQEGQ